MGSAEMDLQVGTNWMTLIALSILIVLGSFGSVCNILIFTSESLKKNSCAFYFLCTALFELPILCFGILTRLANENFGSTLLNHDRFFCKTRSYLITAFGTIPPYLIFLVCLDRCMATSVHVKYRAFSQMKVAYYLSALTIVLGLTINVHALLFFDIQSVCIPQSGTYSIFYSAYLIIFTGVLPNGLILVFSLSTIHNIKKTRTRIAPAITGQSVYRRRTQRMEAQLVIVSRFYSLPYQTSPSCSFVDDVGFGLFVHSHRCNTRIVLRVLFPQHWRPEK